MPITLMPRGQDSGGTPRSASLKEAIGRAERISYKYPRGIKLKPDTNEHSLLRDAIMERAQSSRSDISGRFNSWNKMDEQMTTYIPLSEYDKNFDGDSIQDDDPNKPISIVVPVSKAVLETLLSYLVQAFLDEPILKYDGMGPEDDLGAAVLEHVIMHHSRKGKLGLALHTLFRDGLLYGVGYGSPVWTARTGYRRVAQDSSMMSRLGNFFRTESTLDREEIIKFEGTTLHNIDPYSAFPDTSVPGHELQRGEFFGYIRKENLGEILSREQMDRSFFNGQYLRLMERGTSSLGGDESERDRDSVDANRGVDSAHSNFDVIYMMIYLIPSDYGIGRSTYPEWWLFGLAADTVIISAQPLEFDHGMAPAISFTPDFDGYSACPISKLESVYGMQHLVNFLYNSHVANVRKAVNDMIVFDPEMVNIHDLKNPSPAKLIRLRRKAWGKGVDNAVQQLRITDITSAHLADGGLLQQLIHNYTGATDGLQGVQRRTSERVSATESRDTRMAALNRLEMVARLAGLMFFQDLGEMYASNAQQFMSQDRWVATKGRQEDFLRATLGDHEKIMVGPEDILVNYDVLVNDGTLPNRGDPQLWHQMFQTVSQNEALLQELDVVKIFKQWARLSGAGPLDNYQRQINAQVMPGEEIERQAEAGNIVPLGAGA